MKRKFIISLIVIFFAIPAFAQTYEAGVSFDWISKTQMQRDENISQIKNILLQDNINAKFTKKEFNSRYSEFLKIKDYMSVYDQVSNGVKEDETRNFCGFYINKLLVAYGIQYKNNMKNTYYYDAMGHLRWVDIFSDNYPDFPYWSYQYYRSGGLVAAYYFVSADDQYVFDEHKTFRGRWYKDKFYNRKAKIIMTRSNY